MKIAKAKSECLKSQLKIVKANFERLILMNKVKAKFERLFGKDGSVCLNMKRMALKA